jgi:hypothetical protein
MSYTPRTDAEPWKKSDLPAWDALVEHARTLERELAEATSRISDSQKWVPVAERLPEGDETRQFLTYSTEWGIEARWFEVKGNYRGFCWRSEEGEHVTHWMPLPEAPK